ncbi:hypothetical protein [Urbifossiella limnaea]|uniref:Uncharacterized protein n=1 Tax=Urbifossiella limnaea TaxID=2528023 RepID=A0A517XUU0_9BACT|nr:hypothetical protein [Urbifossiella limnaea]QDU21276.1 hypothetical protein ETAA1_32420 [Urbifossiella limnaea]
MSTRALSRRIGDLARRQAEAGERHAAVAAAVDAGHAERVAFLMMVPEDLRMAVGITLRDPDGDDALHSWVARPFARWAVAPAGFQFPRALVEWLLGRPHAWFLGHHCERCGLGVPLLTTDSRDPSPPPSIVVFPTCPACGGVTSHAANWWTEPPP